MTADPRIAEFARALLDDEWDELNGADEGFEVAVTDLAAELQGAVEDRWQEWRAHYNEQRQNAAVLAADARAVS